MNTLTLSPRRQTGGLNALKEQSKNSGCETPFRPYLKAVDHGKHTVYFIRPDCKSWSCEYCAERRRRLWVYYANFGGGALMDKGHELSFVTLTSHKLVRSLYAGIAVWRKAWPKLSSRWRYHSPGVQYVYMGEGGKVGHFHVHLITTAALNSRWYKDNGAETGLGYQAYAVPIVAVAECGAYVGKYLGKALAVAGWPPYWRRVNTSRNWPRPEEPETPYEWSYLGSDYRPVSTEAATYASMGWVVSHSLNELTLPPGLAT